MQCPNDKDITLISDDFQTPNGPHIRFRDYLKDCRECPIQNKCMKKYVKLQGRQISVSIESKKKTTQLDKMRKVIDSNEGKSDCAMAIVLHGAQC